MYYANASHIEIKNIESIKDMFNSSTCEICKDMEEKYKRSKISSVDKIQEIIKNENLEYVDASKRVLLEENEIFQACFNLYCKTHHIVITFNSQKIICNTY